MFPSSHFGARGGSAPKMSPDLAAPAGAGKAVIRVGRGQNGTGKSAGGDESGGKGVFPILLAASLPPFSS